MLANSLAMEHLYEFFLSSLHFWGYCADAVENRMSN